MDERIASFDPVAAPDARVLILGTMPSVESLRQSFYYAHPRNAFWPMLARILSEPEPASVEEKKALLLRHRIALWDVAQSCVRPGSLDSSIRDALPNDIPGLLKRCPEIQVILFNGATAQNLYRKLIGGVPAGLRSVRMPSTSPAYTLKFEAKQAAWQKELEEIL